MSSSPRKLHRAAIVADAARALREVAIPALVLWVLALGDGGAGEALLRALGYGLVGAVVAGLVGFFRWESTTYRVTDGAVRFRRGMANVQETSVPLERVQSVDEVRGPIQRLFGVVELRVQAAGGGREAEIVLSALSTEAARELREALAGGASEVEGRPEPRPLRRLSRPMLVAAAVTSGQLGAAVPVLVGVAQAFDDVAEELIGSADRATAPEATATLWILVAAVALGAWLLGVIGGIVAFAGFEVVRDGERLRIRRGLLQRREATVPVERVLGVRIVEGVLRQPFGLVQLRVETAGYAQEAAAAQTLFPLMRRSEAAAFVAAALPELEAGVEGLARPPRRAATRYALAPALLVAAPAGAAAILAPAPAALALLLVPVAAAHGLARYAAAGWRQEGGLLVVRFRRLARTTLVARAERLDERKVTQNRLQRRARLASVRFAIGSGARFGVRGLEATTADALYRRPGGPMGYYTF